MWQEMLRNKYLKNSTLSQTLAKPTDSQFWKGLMHVNVDFFNRGCFILGDGTGIRF